MWRPSSNQCLFLLSTGCGKRNAKSEFPCRWVMFSVTASCQCLSAFTAWPELVRYEFPLNVLSHTTHGLGFEVQIQFALAPECLQHRFNVVQYGGIIPLCMMWVYQDQAKTSDYGPSICITTFICKYHPKTIKKGYFVWNPGLPSSWTVSPCKGTGGPRKRRQGCSPFWSRTASHPGGSATPCTSVPATRAMKKKQKKAEEETEKWLAWWSHIQQTLKINHTVNFPINVREKIQHGLIVSQLPWNEQITHQKIKTVR